MHAVGVFAALLVFREGNPSLTGRLLSQRSSDGEFLNSIVFTKVDDDLLKVTIWIIFRGQYGITECIFTVFSYMLGHDREVI